MTRISQSHLEPEERPEKRQGLPTWQGLKPYKKPDDATVCGEWLEDDTLCQKTVRQHIDEMRAVVAKPNTLFSRPSQREMAKYELPDDEVLEQRRQMLLKQAEQIRRGA